MHKFKVLKVENDYDFLSSKREGSIFIPSSLLRLSQYGKAQKCLVTLKVIFGYFLDSNGNDWSSTICLVKVKFIIPKKKG